MNGRIKSFSFCLVLICISMVAHGQDTISTTPKHLKRVRPQFHYPGKNFFFQGEVKVDFLQLGFRVTGGYRFGQFGILGLGFGVDPFVNGLSPQNNLDDPYNGTYFPLYLHYEGDVLKKRVTPFYSMEAGYAFRLSPAANNTYISVSPLDHPVYGNVGGFTGSIGFGVKLYTTRKVYASWAMDLDMKQAQDKYSNYYYNSSGDRISVSYSSTTFFLMPGFKIDVGF